MRSVGSILRFAHLACTGACNVCALDPRGRLHEQTDVNLLPRKYAFTYFQTSSYDFKKVRITHVIARQVTA